MSQNNMLYVSGLFRPKWSSEQKSYHGEMDSIGNVFVGKIKVSVSGRENLTLPMAALKPHSVTASQGRSCLFSTRINGFGSTTNSPYNVNLSELA